MKLPKIESPFMETIADIFLNPTKRQCGPALVQSTLWKGKVGVFAIGHASLFPCLRNVKVWEQSRNGVKDEQETSAWGPNRLSVLEQLMQMRNAYEEWRKAPDLTDHSIVDVRNGPPKEIYIFLIAEAWEIFPITQVLQAWIKKEEVGEKQVLTWICDDGAYYRFCPTRRKGK